MYLATVVWLICLVVGFVTPFSYLLHRSTETSYQSEEMGLHIEPAGLTYAYDEFVYANLVYHVPSVQVDADKIMEGCTELYKKKLRQEINDINRNSMEHLKKSIPEYTSTISRPVDNNSSIRIRRGLPLIPIIAGIAAISMASLVVANTMEVVKLRTKAADLETILNAVRGDQQAFFNKSSELINRVNNIGSVIIPDIETSLRSMTLSSRCGLDGATLNRKVNEQYRDYSNQATQIINALFDHRITPELFPISRLRSDILIRPEFVNSIYRADPMLFYQLTKGYLTSVRHNPFVIASIMIIPILSRELVGTTATVNRVPVMHNNSFLSISAPETVLIDEAREQVWEIDHSKCMSVAISHFCPIQVMHRKSSKCIEGLLFKNDSVACRFVVDRDMPLIKHTLSGLLIGLHNQTIQKITTDRDNKLKTEPVHYMFNQKSLFLHRGFAKEILIDGAVFTLTSPTIDITPDPQIIKMNISQDTVVIHNTTLPPISPLAPLSPVSISWHPVISSTHVLVFLVMCVINFWIIWGLRRRIHTLEILHQHSARLMPIDL